jgi:hypothetical protein
MSRHGCRSGTGLITLSIWDTCCALDSEPSPSISKHIHDIIGKDIDDDQLSKEKMSNGDYDDSPWDFETADTGQPIESCFPTRVGFAKERHHQLFTKYKHIFSRTVKSEPANIPPLKLRVDDDKWKSRKHRLPVRPQSVAKQEEIVKQTRQLLELNCIRTSQSTEWSQVVIAPKPNNKWRFCIDYKFLNLVTDGLGYPIPNIEALLTRIRDRHAKYYAIMDLTSRYHQIPIHEDSRKYAAFITLYGLYEWLRVPFGLKGAPSYFQSMLANEVLKGLLQTACELYIDDILTWGNTEDEYFKNLEEIFKRLDKHNLTLHPDKAAFGMSEVDYVGHRITQEGIT